ncbi:Bug family tripartite tricarboxylate transporter substrate binding protein [Roseomonas sp. BN140053]|uniref:Bug family tripartite tricarboxylate transporter substrate binding protein n=1 Tax=Roseomonas sp. BN140053 TaxID=3391898 RepID=UPI0039EBF8BF
MPHRRSLLGAAALPFLAPLVRPAAAQAPWRPDGPVSFIVPYTPGTAQDVMARLLSPALGESLGQAVVVDNRAGASGLIGTQFVSRAAPDGRTLMIQGVPFAMSPPLMPSLPYDPARSFTPIIRLAEGHVVLAVRPDLPARDLGAFVALAKAKPGDLDYASPGNGTAQHMTMALFNLAAGIELNHVPYRGTAPAVQDLIGQRLAAMMLPVAVALPLARAGQVRLLAIGSDTRSAELPDVPTLAESGYPRASVTLWYGIFGPAGLPAPVAGRLNEVLNAWLARPDTRNVLHGQGLIPGGGTPGEFNTLVQGELVRWAGVVREARITAD